MLTATEPAPTSGAVRPQTRYNYTALAGSSGSIYRLTDISECATTASCSGTADEIKTTLSYDVNLLPNSITKGAGDGSVSANTSIVYDGVGNRYTVQGPLGSAQTMRYRYDVDRELVGTIGPDPDGSGPLLDRAVRNTYNGQGLVTEVDYGTVNSQSDSDWGGFTVLSEKTAGYDARRNKIYDATISGGSVLMLTQYGYDTPGRLQCVAVRDPATLGSLPASACSTTGTTVAGADRIVQYSYDAANEMLNTTAGYGTSDQAVEISKTYGADGETSTAGDADNHTTAYVYDGFNRLSQVQYPDPTSGQPSSAATDNFVYDASSNITTWTHRNGLASTYVYDALNRQTNETPPSGGNGQLINTSYDNLGRRKTVSATLMPQNTPTVVDALSYDALGRLTAEQQPMGTVSSTYDAAGRRIRLTWPDGYYVGYTYDMTGAMTAMEENGATSGVGLLATFTYDNLGRRTGLARGNGVITAYGYDGASRLSSMSESFPQGSFNQTESFTYNAAGQLSSRTASNDAYAWNAAYNVNRPYTSNGLNELSTSGGLTLSYTPKGTVSSDGVNSYSTDIDNRLTALTTSPYASLNYDGFSRLDAVTGSATTQFLYDGQDIVAEYDGNGTFQRRYARGPDQDEELVWYEGGMRNWLSANYQGSITAISSDAGSVTAIDSYDEYGLPGSSNIGRFQYTGQPWIPEIGLYDYRARMYSPTLGRFVQPDPISYAAGMNIYSYTDNDPINEVDPKGTDPVETVVVTAIPIPVVQQIAVVATVIEDVFQLFGLFGPAPGPHPPPKPKPKNMQQQNTQHQYDKTYKVCQQGGYCTVQAVYRCLTENPAPGVTGAPVHSGAIENVPILGPITVTVSPSTMTIVNSTLPNHELYPGYVIRSVVTDGNGNIGINNSGYGTGNLGKINSALAPWVWSYQTTLQISSCVAAGK